MSETELDLFVIGGGSGGVRAARIAAGHGARVALAEEYRMGGTCVVRGCIPKKLYHYASEFGHMRELGKNYGWTFDGATFDWNTLVTNKENEITRLTGLYEGGLDRAGASVLCGRATIIDSHTVEVNGSRYHTQHILLATGGTPFIPQIEGHELFGTSNDAFDIPEFPRRVVIVGGGYIAVEFAFIFAGLGAAVTLVHRGTAVLRGFDAGIRECVTANLNKAVNLKLETRVDRAHQVEGRNIAELTSGESVEFDFGMFATGRTPNTDGLGLNAVGVKLGTRGQIIVDNHSKSSVDNIYAVGDCTERFSLTPIAIREGHAFADTVFGNTPRTVDYETIPTAVFAAPPAATVGMPEYQAREVYGQIDVYHSSFRPLLISLTDSDERVWIKMLVAKATGRVVGLHMVGRDAPEIIQAAAVAIRMGATKADFDATVALHPSTAEELVLLR